jgi:hypothetical protein
LIGAGRGLRTRLWGSMSTEAMPASSTSLLVTDSDGDISLLDILDHVLNSGVVVHGSLVISLAGVDLVYVGLNVVLTSVETALRNIDRGHGDAPGQHPSSSPRAS